MVKGGMEISVGSLQLTGLPPGKPSYLCAIKKNVVGLYREPLRVSAKLLGGGDNTFCTRL